MEKRQPLLPTKMVVEYADATTKHGVGSPESVAVREKYAPHRLAEAFGKFADGYDLLKIGAMKRELSNLPPKFIRLSPKLIEEYSDAVALHGVGSPEAIAVRQKYADHKSAEIFTEFADRLDRLKESGIDQEQGRGKTV